MKNNLSGPFLTAYNSIENLQKHSRYLGAFIFGSVARGDSSSDSDFDSVVVVDDDNECKEVNHPIINGVKVDISFRSLKQIEENSREAIKKGERLPFISESVIVFDKTGILTKLKKRFANLKRKRARAGDFQFIQFMIYHADNKSKRNLQTDPATALLAMDININEILKFHYHIHGRWWISNKRLLSDLRSWNPDLATKIERFVLTANVKTKYKYWEEILDLVAKHIGGRKDISELVCTCSTCQNDLKALKHL